MPIIPSCASDDPDAGRGPAPLTRMGDAAALAAALSLLAGCASSATPTPQPTPTAPTSVPTASPAPPATASATPKSTLAAAESSPAATATSVPTAPPTATPSPTAGAPTATAAPTATPQPAAPAAVVTTETWRQTGVDLGSLALSATAFDGAQLKLAQDAGRYVASGQATSTIRETPFAFDHAVLSWNADAPAGTSLKLELRARTPDGWSSWYTMGTWGPNGGSSAGAQASQWGSVDIDTLVLKARASALQYRATLATKDPTATPTLRLVAVSYSVGSGAPAGPKLPSGVALGRDLDVPRFSQVDQDPSLAWEVCSPTSLTMVLRYWGVDRTVPETIRGVKDAATGIWGNWALNAAFAGSQGLEAYVDRFSSVEQLEAEIAAGRPVITSVRWGAGQLDNASVPSATTGHLIVVRGFTDQGDVIVNDPAGQGEGVRRVYKRAQFANIWLKQGGVVYLVHPRQ